jgi:formamidopyrimidine-DNA glycosylase
VPELPEVETTARSLHRQVAGDVIESVWIGDKTNLLKSPAEEIARTLEGSRIDGVRRVGKHIVIDIRRDHAGLRRRGTIQSTAQAQWVVHLGMTGRMLVSDAAAERAKHTHLVAQLASGRELRFVDPRRFGKLQVILEGSFQAPGSEPIGANREAFAKLFEGRKTPIKSALLNQKLLSGIGNIYADESLFRAAIRPRRRAASLTRAELSRLYDSIQKVLAEAIAAGGSSISDYVDAAGAAGFFQLQHRVYGREDEACLVCKTPIKRIVIAGRSSHYCPRCQK